MATHRLLVLLSILLTFTTISISVTARPCKTVLFVTSSTSSSSLHPNQNPNLLFPNPRFMTFSYSTSQEDETRPVNENSDSSVGSSIRDRTLDILSIVSALLFGVGCGALTAATMYLMWYICSSRALDLCDDDDEEEESVVKTVVFAAKKKLGYVPIEQTIPLSMD